MSAVPEEVTVRLTVALCWTPPPLPVTVIEYVPVAVLAPTFIVIVEVPAPGAAMVVGLKLTVVPEGTPEADRLTALLNPPFTVVVIVDVPWLPCATLTEVGAAEIAKPAAAVTVRLTVALCWTPPPLPVMVIEYVPVAVLAPTFIVIVELPAPGAAMVVGLKLTVVPEGTPEADRLTALLNPPFTVVVIVDVPWLPCPTVTERGEAEMLKLGPAPAEFARRATICMTHAPAEDRGALAV